MSIPDTITAGDTVSWQQDTLGDFSPATHGLAFSLRGPSEAAKLDLTGVPASTRWALTISSAQSAALNTAPATVVWYWQCTATALVGGAVTAFASGTLKVRPNLASLSGNFDGRSQTERDLEAVRKAITARAENGLVLTYTIGNRNLQRESVKGLLELQSMLEARLRREKTAASLAAGLGNPAKILVRFGRGRGVPSGD